MGFVVEQPLGIRNLEVEIGNWGVCKLTPLPQLTIIN